MTRPLSIDDLDDAQPPSAEAVDSSQPEMAATAAPKMAEASPETQTVDRAAPFPLPDWMFPGRRAFEPPQAPMPLPGMLPPGAMGSPSRSNPLAALVLGLMAGAGPRSGLGVGAAQGFQQVEAQRRAQEDQREKQLIGALDTMRQRRDQIRTKPQYDAEVDGWAAQLRSAGYRLDSNWVRRAVPFVAPDRKKAAADAVQAFLKNPANKQLIEQHPEQLADVVVLFDRDHDGMPEQTPLLLLAQIGDVPFSVDIAGDLISYPKGTSDDDRVTIDADFKDALAQAHAEGKNVKDPSVRRTLRQRVMADWEGRRRLTGGAQPGRGTPYQDARAQAVAEYVDQFGIPRGGVPAGGAFRAVSDRGSGQAPSALRFANEWINKRTAEVMEMSQPASARAPNYQTKTGIVPGYEKMGPIQYQLDPQTGGVYVGGKSLGPVIVKDPSPADDPLKPRDRFEMARALANDLDKATKPVREMKRQLNLMETALSRWKADPVGSEQAIVNPFNKILDPNSVVMVSEYAKTADGLAMIDRIQGMVQRLKTGGSIPEHVLKGLVDTSRALVDSMAGYSDEIRSRTDAQIREHKLNPETIYGKPVAAKDPGIRRRAADTLKRAGRNSADSDIDLFLKNNPNFK